MSRTSVSLRLREKLGHEASEDLALALEDAKSDMLAVSQDKFETRLSVAATELRQDMAKLDANLRVTMTEGFSAVRKDLFEMRSDIIRMSFLFWIGQFVALVSVVALMLRSLAR